MKKSILTLALVAFFSVAVNAQTTKGTKTKSKTQEPPAAVTVNDDGTTSTPAATNSPDKEKKDEATIGKKEETPVKKSGTRMAINEKGTSSGVKPKSTARSEDKKSTETSAPQPGSAGTKKD
ncbi:MAG: hypothetical protein K0S32_2298 [Bacteroidetes bacterium]|jgi:hypothetical protein|nr:hypothetical protein [Bacteroidota bacterium]